jgi:4-oxalocrotonate tautomerase
MGVCAQSRRKTTCVTAAGKSAAFRSAVSNGIHQAMLATFNVPADDFFQILSEGTPGTDILRPKEYLGNIYSDDLIIIQITCNDTRTVDQKKALYAPSWTISRRIPDSGATDIFINLVEVKKEDWSFGSGIAQYAT